MARIARVVVPDLPHHVTQRGNRREPVFRGRRLSLLSATGRGGGAPRLCRSLGLLPDAQSRPSDRDAGGRGWVAGDLFRGAPALHRGHQRSFPVDGPSVPGSLWRGGDGRAAFGGGRALHRSQSGGRGVGEPYRGLAMVEHSGQLAGEDYELATVAPLRALIPDFAALLAMPTDAAVIAQIERAPTQ